MNVLPTSAEVAERRRRGGALAKRQGVADLRVTVLSTFNLDLFPPFLVEALDTNGIAAEVRTGPFGQLGAQILDPGSELYRDAPDEVLLVPAAEDWLESVYATAPSELTPAAVDELIDERLSELRLLVDVVLERLPRATCSVVAFGSERAPFEFALSPSAPERGQAAVERFVEGVRALEQASSRVVVVDWDWHIRSDGWAGARDERLWYVGRMRLGQAGCAGLASLAARYTAARLGKVKKVVALDFDGLLWGGVIGEAGLGGIELGGDGVGLAFQDVQRELLRLRDVGVLLVACSKNNLDDAVEVLERHPEMILKREHLAAERINWRDKASNLRELADELDLGLDSFVFLDDNPVERGWVSEACPEVLVPEVPDDPVERPSFLRSAPWFARLVTTESDRGRAESYRLQRERRQVASTASSYEDFLATLDQSVTFSPVDEGSLARAAQLTQRTNQFNLTTRRYSVADVERMIGDPDFELFTMSVRDRFGDSGITGLVIVEHRGAESVVDTFLMSCRVLGRRLEDALLAFVAERAAARGASTLVGVYEPTAKNGQVATFYPDRGFTADGDGTFRLDLRNEAPLMPQGLRIEVTANA